MDRATLAFWVGYAAAEVAPVVARLREMVLGSARVFADETTVPVLDPGRGRTKTGYFWTVARDDRPWGGTDPPAVVYSYAPGRGHQHAHALLGGYRGILQCDGYPAYKALAKAPPDADGRAVTLVFCWSHVRRGFTDLAKGEAAPIATEALVRIAALYRIEATVRGRDPEHRRGVRQAQSRTLVAELRTWLEAQLTKVPARGPTAEAIRYALNHWERAGAVPGRRPHRDGHQQRRARHAPGGLVAQERPVCWQRRGWRTVGGDRLAGGDLQAQRHQPADLPRRPARPASSTDGPRPASTNSCRGAGRRHRSEHSRHIGKGLGTTLICTGRRRWPRATTARRWQPASGPWRRRWRPTRRGSTRSWLMRRAGPRTSEATTCPTWARRPRRCGPARP